MAVAKALSARKGKFSRLHCLHKFLNFCTVVASDINAGRLAFAKDYGLLTARNSAESFSLYVGISGY